MKKTILITGASSGIGKETAKYFAGKGWNVAATMRSPEKEEELTSFPEIRIYKLDVTTQEEIREAVKAVNSDFRGIDVLLNNAGYGAIGAFEKSSEEERRRQFDVNVLGLMSVTRETIPYFRRQGFGMIINISSVAGRMTSPLYTLYNASKWAVEGFAESLQYELRKFNIQVKNIQPGPIKIDFRSRSMNFFQKDDVNGYEDMENAIFGSMEERNKKAPDPIVVAKTIYKAATDGKNKLRYPADKQAKFILTFRKILPNRWFNNLVLKQQVGTKGRS